jgi:hypothetical protein
MNISVLQRLRMRKGFPAFEWWADPPQDVLVRLYVFNVSNYEQIINGSQTKLHLQEIGPYIFRFVSLQWHNLASVFCCAFCLQKVARYNDYGLPYVHTCMHAYIH